MIFDNLFLFLALQILVTTDGGEQPDMNHKIKDLAVLIEFVTGSGLAIFFHWVLHYPEAAYIIFGVSILLSMATYLIREGIEKKHDQLLDKYDHAHEITFAISRISDPECQIKAQELMAASMRTILLLQQGYIPMEEMEFYLEGGRQMDQATQQVKSVDPLTAGWDSRGALVNFYQANLRAVERGTKVSRIFVSSRQEFALPEIQKILHAQYHDKIDVRIAFRDELPSVSDISNRDTNSSFDFAIYDGLVVTDVFSKTGKYFGRKTCRPVEVAKYQHLYDLIEHSSHTITVEDDKIILATKSISPVDTMPRTTLKNQLARVLIPAQVRSQTADSTVGHTPRPGPATPDVAPVPQPVPDLSL